MGTPKLEPRSRFVGLRFTEKEFVQLQAQMANADYLSLSKYLRDKALDRQIQINKNVVLTDRNLRNQINNITATISKIGVDYNQATKKFHTLSKMKRPDGSPVINVRAANFYLISLQKMTRDLNKAMDQVIEIVSRLDYDNVPHGGEQQ